MADDWSQFPDAGQDQWSQFPDAAKAKYIPVPVQNYGDDEEIYFEETGDTVKAPSGSAKILQDTQSSPLYENELRVTIRPRPKNYKTSEDIIYGTDATSAPSTFVEETAAMTEKQAANLALMASAFGLVTDDNMADFVAERSQALASAQQRAPEYMKEFNRKYDEANGFFEAAGVMLSNPSALGRIAITQAPNSILPLMTTLAGTATGATLGPVGATAGGVGGAFVGSSITEIGAELDGMLLEAGYDTSDANQVRAALSDKNLMDMIKEKAVRKGITTGAVDGLFQIFGGRFLRAFGEGATGIKKAGVAATDVGVQAAGEATGEAAGQYAKDGRVDYKDAMLEAVSSITTSVGQTAIGEGRKATTKPEPPPPEVTLNTPEVAQVVATPIQDIPAQESAKIVTDFLEGREVDISNYDEAKQKAILGVLDRAKAAQPAIIKGRVRKLDADIETTLSTLDAVEREIEVAKSEGKPIKRLQNQAKKLSEQWLALDEERGGLLTVEDVVSETVDTVDKEITVKGKDLVRLEKRVTQESLRAVNKAFREARTATKRDVRATQKTLIEAIRESGLTKEDQASFINTISAVQTQEQLVKKAPAIQQKIEQKLNKRLRKDTTAKINKLLGRLKKTNVVAVDYINKIEEMVKAFDLKGMTDAKRAELEATAKYLNDNPSASMPKSVIKKLERLAKTRNEEIATQDLVDLYEDMKQQVGVGAAKLRLMRKQKERRLKQRLEELRVDTKPLMTQPIKNMPLDRKLTALESFRNKVTEARNLAYKLYVNKNIMDVIFDIKDGGKNYSGANSRVFKQTADAAYGRYLDLQEATSREVAELGNELKLNDLNYRRIGVYAVAQQENGRSKLNDTGYSDADIDSVALSEQEQQMYNLMREKLDSLLPALKEIMRVVYNKDVEAVQDYFPFLTDFSKMEDMQVQDRIGLTVDFETKQKNIARGQTISRVGGKQAVRINALDVFMSHVDNTAYLIEMGQTVKELGDLAQSKEYGEIAGDFGQQIVVDWIDLMARKGSAKNKNPMLDTLRRNTGFAILAFKLSTIGAQFTALLDGAGRINPRWMTSGVTAVSTSRDWRLYMKDHFPEVRRRVGDDPAYLDGSSGVLSGVQKLGMLPIKTVDSWVASSVAAGAYQKFMHRSGKDIDLSLPPDQEGVMYAERMMRLSQSSALSKDASPMITQGKITGSVSFDKALTQFQSFMLTRWSSIENDIFRTGLRKGNRAGALNLATFLVLSMVAEDQMRFALTKLFGKEEDDDEELAEKVFKKVGRQVPFLSSAISSIEYGSLPLPLLSMPLGSLEEMKYAYMSEDPDKIKEHLIKAGAKMAGGVSGVPVVGPMELYNLFIEDEEDRKGGRR